MHSTGFFFALSHTHTQARTYTLMAVLLSPLYYCSEQGRKKVRILICRASCSSAPSAHPSYLGVTTTCAGGREICLPSLLVACFIGMADWQMLMVCMCAHTEHISYQVKALADTMICVCVRGCASVCVFYDLLFRVCAVAESATVLQQQQQQQWLIFIKICCSELATGTEERDDWKRKRKTLLRGLNAAVITYRL